MGSEGLTFEELQVVVEEIRKQSKGFVRSCGEGFHILFNVKEVSKHFKGIRKCLKLGVVGRVLRKAVGKGLISEHSSNREIWDFLIESLQFNGVDFEHEYDILPGGSGVGSLWPYCFDETIVLSHTMLLAPVMQHYGPLVPTMNLGGGVAKFASPSPLLAVAMIGDCVKGNFWQDIVQKANQGNLDAECQRHLLLNPERLQQKMRSLLAALIDARQRKGRGLPMRVDATLVGAGAFGGSAKNLAQAWADSLKQMEWHPDDKVNFFAFPCPKPEELSIADLDYKAEVNPPNGLAGAPLQNKELRIAITGFDPLSLAPHGVRYRVVSAEGQICHASDFLSRVTGQRGRFVGVHMSPCKAWASPAAFFATPQREEFTEKAAYDSVRFVPEMAFRALSPGVQFVGEPIGGKLVWNGDAFEGFSLRAGGKACLTWVEAIDRKSELQPFEVSTVSGSSRAVPKPVLMVVLLVCIALVAGFSIYMLWPSAIVLRRSYNAITEIEAFTI